MSHVRTQIRAQATTELSALYPATFSEVTSTRMYHWRETNLPACNVYTDPEESAPIMMGGKGARKVERSVQLITEIYATDAEDTIDDTVDALCVDVEKILGASVLNGLALEVSLMTSEFDFDVEGEIPVGIATLTWQVRYYTTEGDPETAL